MQWPTATAGVVGVLCSSATDRTTATAVAQRLVGFVVAMTQPGANSRDALQPARPASLSSFIHLAFRFDFGRRISCAKYH